MTYSIRANMVQHGYHPCDCGRPLFRELYLLRFSLLFSANKSTINMLHGTAAGALKCLDLDLLHNLMNALLDMV